MPSAEDNTWYLLCYRRQTEYCEVEAYEICLHISYALFPHFTQGLEIPGENLTNKLMTRQHSEFWLFLSGARHRFFLFSSLFFLCHFPFFLFLSFLLSSPPSPLSLPFLLLLSLPSPSFLPSLLPSFSFLLSRSCYYATRSWATMLEVLKFNHMDTHNLGNILYIMVFEMECPNWAHLGNMVSKICEDTDEPRRRNIQGFQCPSVREWGRKRTELQERVPGGLEQRKVFRCHFQWP